MFVCPVCFFDGLAEPARNYNICDCCGTEFGNDDEHKSHDKLRREWIQGGARWFFGEAPAGWDFILQVVNGYQHTVYPTATPAFGGNPSFDAVVKTEQAQTCGDVLEIAA